MFHLAPQFPSSIATCQHFRLCPHLHHTDLYAEHTHSITHVEKVQHWIRKRQLKCTECELSLFGYQVGSSDFTVTRTDILKGTLKLLHNKCIWAKPGRLFLFFYVGCGARLLHSPIRLLKQHYKCTQVSDEHPTALEPLTSRAATTVERNSTGALTEETQDISTPCSRGKGGALDLVDQTVRSTETRRNCLEDAWNILYR